MYLFDHSFPQIEQNLAFDEALVECADRVWGEGQAGGELLRLWEMPQLCVVIGRASRRAEEVRLDNCERDGVPVFRRMSGGAAIVAGPGCLMYSVLISYEQRPSWRGLDVAHREVMSRISNAVQKSLIELGSPARVCLEGTCDLTLNGKKFSGNALRCKRHWMLYHGTVLLTMPTQVLSTYLLEPPRQPDYRDHREHSQFVTRLAEEIASTNASLLPTRLCENLRSQWQADQDWETFPLKEMVAAETQSLQHSRYQNPQWHNSR